LFVVRTLLLRARRRLLPLVPCGLLAALLGLGTARGSTATWQPTAGGSYSWSNVANWGGSIPNGNGDTADVTSALTGNQIISLDAPITLKVLNLGPSTGSYNFQIVPGAGGSLQFNIPPAGINSSQNGTPTSPNLIAVPIDLGGSTTIAHTTNAGGLIISGNITSSANRTLTLGSGSATGGITVSGDISLGTGNLVLSGASGRTITLSGNNATVANVSFAGSGTAALPTGITSSNLATKATVVATNANALGSDTTLTGLGTGTGIVFNTAGSFSWGAGKAVQPNAGTQGNYLAATGGGVVTFQGTMNWTAANGFVYAGAGSVLEFGAGAHLNNLLSAGPPATYVPTYAFGTGTVRYAAGFNVAAVSPGGPLEYGDFQRHYEGTMEVRTTNGNRWMSASGYRATNQGADVTTKNATTLRIDVTRTETTATGSGVLFEKTDATGGAAASQFLDVTAGNTWTIGSGLTFSLNNGSTLNKIGAGTLTLQGTLAANQTGAILNVNAGRVQFDTPAVNTTKIAVNVANGATLGGTGSFTGPITVAGGGKITGGNGNVGTFTIGTAAAPDTVTLSAGATYDWKIAVAGGANLTGNGFSTANGAAHDQLVLPGNGTLSLTGSTVNVTGINSFLGTFDPTKRYSWTVASITGTPTITGSPTLGTVSGYGGVPSGSFQIAVVGGGVYLNYQPTPEPAHVLLIGAGGAVLGKMVRRLRRTRGGVTAS
jgi:fibronectin-binding autotransporter adhesin